MSWLCEHAVPSGTSEMYYRRLLSSGVDTRRVLQSGGNHAWSRQSAAEILRWLDVHG
jgi:hypothetical protein